MYKELWAILTFLATSCKQTELWYVNQLLPKLQTTWRPTTALWSAIVADAELYLENISTEEPPDRDEVMQVERLLADWIQANHEFGPTGLYHVASPNCRCGCVGDPLMPRLTLYTVDLEIADPVEQRLRSDQASAWASTATKAIELVELELRQQGHTLWILSQVLALPHRMEGDRFVDRVYGEGEPLVSL